MSARQPSEHPDRPTRPREMRDGKGESLLHIAALFNGRTEVHGLFSSQSVAEYWLLKKANVETVGKGGGWWRRAGAPLLGRRRARAGRSGRALAP